MAGLTDAAKNAMLDALGTTYPYVSLHSADPGTGGTNELTGGSPAYARKAASWSAASGGSKAYNPAAHDVPAGSTVAYLGFWTAASGGSFGGSRAVTPESFAGQGTYDASGTESLT